MLHVSKKNTCKHLVPIFVDSFLVCLAAWFGKTFGAKKYNWTIEVYEEAGQILGKLSEHGVLLQLVRKRERDLGIHWQRLGGTENKQ